MKFKNNKILNKLKITPRFINIKKEKKFKYLIHKS